MRTQEIVAANVRARLAWARLTMDDALYVAQCSARSFRYKLAGVYPFRPDELDRLAPYLGVEEVSELFRVPAGFSAPPAAPAPSPRRRRLSAPTEVSESAWMRSLAA
jgi:hypothetical protein